MQTFMAATALAGLIGVPAEANAGRGCSERWSKRQSRPTPPIASYVRWEAVIKLHDRIDQGLLRVSTARAAIPLLLSTRTHRTITRHPFDSDASESAGRQRVGSYRTARSLATAPYADATPSCCADGGSSCCRRWRLKLLPEQSWRGSDYFAYDDAAQHLGERRLADPAHCTSQQSGTSHGNVQCSIRTTTSSAPVANDPHAGHQH